MHDLERYGLTISDLPEWLRPKQNRFDYALLSMVLLCVVVAWPWLRASGIPNTMGAWEQVFRISEVAENLQSGDLYPRWASRYHYSYGSPVFNYLAPAPHYLGGMHYLLTQTSPRISLKLLIVVSILMAGLGMFSFGRRRWGTLAGFCAALVYLLAPPLLLTLPYITVDLPLLLAAGVFPCLLWSLDRVLVHGSGQDIAILILLTSLQIMAHNTVGPIFLGIALFWWLFMGGAKHLGRCLLGIAAGIGTAAIYWLPALLERHEVHWIPFETTARPLRLSEVLGLLPTQDFLVFNPDSPAGLGLAAWGLFLLGSIICLGELTRRTTRKQALAVVPFMVAAPVLIWIATEYQSTWLDSTSKFPALSRSDLLVPAAACCALVAAQCARIVDPLQRPLKLPALFLLTSAIVGSSFYVMKPPVFVPYRLEDGRVAHLEAELRGAFSGAFHNGQLLPEGLDTLPAPSDYLLDSYERGTVEKLSRNSLLVRSELAFFSHTPTQDRVRLTSYEEGSQVEFLTLNFPGWQAEFRNEPVPVESPNGFIQVILPAGRGVLHVFLGSTLARTLGTIITAFSLLIIPLALVAFRKQSVSSVQESRPTIQLTLSLGLLAVIGIGVAREYMPTRSRLETMTPLPLVFEGGVDLLGFDSETLQPGQISKLTFYWERARPNLPDYRFDVWLIDPATQRIIWQETHRAPGGWPTSYWQENRYVQDTYWIVVPEEIPEGEYKITVQVTCESRSTLLTCAETIPLQVFDARGRPLGDSAVLPITLTVRR